MRRVVRCVALRCVALQEPVCDDSPLTPGGWVVCMSMCVSGWPLAVSKIPDPRPSSVCCLSAVCRGSPRLKLATCDFRTCDLATCCTLRPSAGRACEILAFRFVEIYWLILAGKRKRQRHHLHSARHTNRESLYEWLVCSLVPPLRDQPMSSVATVPDIAVLYLSFVEIQRASKCWLTTKSTSVTIGLCLCLALRVHVFWCVPEWPTQWHFAWCMKGR
jgi:hypothetical protein